MDGRKDILGVWIGENESAKFWLSVMNDLKNRGVKDVYVFCVDGLSGFREAINAAFPMSRTQRLHCSPVPFLNSLCKPQEYQINDGRPEESLSGDQWGRGAECTA